MLFILQHLGCSLQSSLAMTDPVEQQFLLSAKPGFLQRVLVVSSGHLLPLLPHTSELQDIQGGYRIHSLGHTIMKSTNLLHLFLLHIAFIMIPLHETPCHAQNAAHHCSSISFFQSWLIFLAWVLSWIQLR